MGKVLKKNERAARRSGESLLARAETIPELLNIVRRVCRRVSGDDWVHQKVLKSVMTELAKADFKRSPAEILMEVMGGALKALGAADPFAEEKREACERMLAKLPVLRKRISAAKNRLVAAARLAIAGNVIDPASAEEYDIDAELSRALKAAPAIDDSGPFREAVSSADHILYLLGCAGEAVLDRLLLAEIKRLGKPITVVARKSPVLFAATEADAAQAGLEEYADIINPGREMLGIVVSHTSPEFQEAFRVSDVVIAKDQTHYETLLGADREIFFLFKVKTPLAAGRLSLRVGASVLLRKHPEEEPL